ncbi:MAG TPA: diaminopimelate decarboxylase [Gemmatimonadota bacterium]|nr:diaminopimelate decarboxylase [Gemmatimonadota bacterium]
MDTPFRYEEGELRAGGVPLARLAAEHGTPLYVYHRPTIEARLDAVRRAFRDHPTRVCYSVKANSNLRLLKWLAGLGVGFDVVSAGEIARTAVCGIPADRVVFAGVGKTRAELKAGVEAGLWMINVESVDEARVLAEIAGRRGEPRVPISLRVNPDVDAGTHRHITTGTSADKFGISPSEYRSLLPWLASAPALELVGLHMHLGSQIMDPAPYGRGIAVLLGCGAEARAAGLDPRWVNAGGGFGIAYDGGEAPLPATYAAALIPAVREFGAELLLELGRYLVGPAGCLLTEVQYRKSRGGRELVITDAGMTDLLRPALYEAFHRIVPVSESDPADARATDVAGPICESTDFLGRARPLPPLERGELLAVLDAGAYGMSMASHYNTHPRAAEVWIDERGSVEQIRRRETAADLLAVEREALDETRYAPGP